MPRTQLAMNIYQWAHALEPIGSIVIAFSMQSDSTESKIHRCPAVIMRLRISPGVCYTTLFQVNYTADCSLFTISPRTNSRDKVPKDNRTIRAVAESTYA